MPAADGLQQGPRVIAVEGEEVVSDAEQVADYAPRVQVGVGVFRRVPEVGAVEHLEHDLGEGEQGLEQVLLVDRLTPRRVPAGSGRRIRGLGHLRVVEDEPAGARVHQPDVAHVAVPRRSRLEAARPKDVDVELRRLVQPPAGVGPQPGGEEQYLHSPVTGVGHRERRAEQGGKDVKAPVAEPLRRPSDLGRVGPWRPCCRCPQVGRDRWVLLLGIEADVANEVAKELPLVDRADRGRGSVGEVRRNRVIGDRVGDLAQPIQRPCRPRSAPCTLPSRREG